MLITHLLLILEFCYVKPTFGNHLLKSSDVVRFDLGSIVQGQTRIATLKSAYNSLIIGCETNLKEIMGWESYDVVRFNLGPKVKRG